ncbi:replication protein A 32 kDa subunit [Diachasmimorpha longicaudata]|uniref:replication protein A 32 kDa subunit n=1 Tax=Diachasmimorpha longicaudata TaxID=58733 RepID=UPI0030B89082
MWGDLKAGESEGGFMDESYSTGGQQTQKDSKKRDDNKIILPIMIGTLLHETPQSLQHHGNNGVSSLRVVAVVTKITEATTKLAYELEDETGKITAYRWLETDSTTADVVDIKVNQYVIIHGCLRESGEESRHLFILNIRPSVTHGEVLNHLLEVVMVARYKNAALPHANTTAGGIDNTDNRITTGLTPDQMTVYNLIKQYDTSDLGVERDFLKSKIPPQMISKVDEIIDFLASEGHLYTTRTDDHFKAT